MERIPLTAAAYYPILDARQPPTLVIFTAPACGSCRRLHRIIDDMVAPISDMVVMEVNAEEAPGLVADLEIFHLPALFLYMHGDHHSPVHSVLRVDALAAAVQAAAAGPRQEPP